jgi:hypothetical protein
VPVPYAAKLGLEPVRYAPALADSVESWPSDDLWLVGHRALRDVLRVAAVWTFLTEEFRAEAPYRIRTPHHEQIPSSTIIV